jgi:outer membrane murein-binding lipoprotein Lpp
MMNESNGPCHSGAPVGYDGLMGRRLKTTLAALVVSTAALALAAVLSQVQVHRLRTTVDDLAADVERLQDTVARRDAEASWPVSPLLMDYQLDVPGRGEVFPAMAEVEAPEYWPVAVLRVTNTADRAVAQTVSAEIPGWSRRSERSVVLGPRETQHVAIQPELLPHALENEETRSARLEVRAIGPDASVLFVEGRTVLIHAGSEIYWGRRFANAQVTARWVTPHDPSVLALVAEARPYVPRGRLAGYNAGPDPAAVPPYVRAQAEAIFRALKRAGITYVSSLFVMGEHVGQAQRIRLPRETLALASANCMDVSVAFASAAENIGLQPLLVIVPGHAFAGVRLERDSQKVLYFDLTVLPKGSFTSAVARANSWLRKTPAKKVLVVDVAAARTLGVYPLAPRTPPA